MSPTVTFGHHHVFDAILDCPQQSSLLGGAALSAFRTVQRSRIKELKAAVLHYQDVDRSDLGQDLREEKGFERFS